MFSDEMQTDSGDEATEVRKCNVICNTVLRNGYKLYVITMKPV